MTVLIVAEATKTGVLTTGLKVQITIYDLNSATPGTAILTAQDFTEIGHGLYLYKFTAADINHKYAGYVDLDSDGAGGLVATERYENCIIDPSLGYIVAV